MILKNWMINVILYLSLCIICYLYFGFGVWFTENGSLNSFTWPDSVRPAFLFSIVLCAPITGLIRTM